MRTWEKSNTDSRIVRPKTKLQGYTQPIVKNIVMKKYMESQQSNRQIITWEIISVKLQNHVSTHLAKMRLQTINNEKHTYQSKKKKLMKSIPMKQVNMESQQGNTQMMSTAECKQLSSNSINCQYA